MGPFLAHFPRTFPLHLRRSCPARTIDRVRRKRAPWAPPGLKIWLSGLAAAAAPQGRAAFAQPAAQIANQTSTNWLLSGLLVLAVAALLAWLLRDLLADAWQWVVVNIGGLLAPLRSRRHVIHDPRYLRSLLEAEINDSVANVDQGLQASRSHHANQERTRSNG